MNKILMVCPHPEMKGGISSVVRLYQKYSYLSNYDIKFLYTSREGSKLIKFLYFNKALIIYLFYLIDSTIKAIHIHTASYNSFLRKYYVVKIGKFFGKIIIIHIHGAEFMIFYKKANENLKRKIRNTLDKSDIIIALSKEWKKNLSKITSNKNIVVLNNPVEVPKYTQRKNNGRVDFLFLGRLGKRKGTFDLIKAVKKVRANNFRVLLAGDGEIDTVKELISTQNLSSKIKILGWIDEKKKHKLLVDSDVYLLPSYNEGLPISIIEAMAFSLPIISTNVGGIPTIVKNNVDGYLIKPGNVNELSKKMSDLISNPNKRIKFGRLSYEIVSKEFNIQKIMKRLEEVYNSLT